MAPAVQPDAVRRGARAPALNALVGACTSALLLLAACGGGGDDTAPALQATAPQAAVPSAASIEPPAYAPPQHLAPQARVSPYDDLASLKRQLQQLSAEVADLRRRIDRGSGAASSGVPAPAAANDMQRAAASDAAFQAEPIDPAWSRRAVAAVQEAFARAEAARGAQISQVECRSKSCRVELGAQDADAIAGALPAVLEGLAVLLPNATAVQMDRGSSHPSTTLLYLSH